MLALLCVFTVSAFFVVIFGARAYRQIAQSMETNYCARTSMAYLTQKARQGDVGDAIRVDDVSGGDALVITQIMAGQAYETWIYWHAGTLCEVTVRRGTEVLPGDGQMVMELASLHMTLASSGLLTFETADSYGGKARASVWIRSE